MSTNMLSDVGKNFGRSLLYLDPNPNETNSFDEFQSQPFQCRASVEKDEDLNITRYGKSPEGVFINDVTQLRGGSLFCDSLNRVVSKMVILV